MIISLGLAMLIVLFLHIFPHFYNPKSILLKEKTHSSVLPDNKHQQVYQHNYCKTIHIGFVCSGHTSNMHVHTLLKSIYFYRVSPIHFHIIVNKFSEKVIKTLFETWKVPQVNTSFYNSDELIQDLEWIPNTHYSGIHGLLKITFPTIISLRITERIIVLDVDLIVSDDIYNLWNLFKKFNSVQYLGIADNQSKYYLKKFAKHQPWPAIGTGYNSGVILYDLKKIRNTNWTQLWTSITKRIAAVYGPAKLGDQDIINGIIKENPQIMYKLPCYWNVQLSDRTESSGCYERSKVKIVHWNSPQKYTSIAKNKDTLYFQNLAYSFIQLNGNLMRKELQICGTKDVFEKLINEPINAFQDPCKGFSKSLISYRQFIYLKEINYSVTENDVTFVAQLSFERILSIEYLAKYWEGPISLAIYTTDEELVKIITFIENSKILMKRQNIAYLAVFKDKEYYPINTLRNVALRNVVTPFVFLADIDFIPMSNLYQILKSHIALYATMKKKALIVPAFEIKKYRTRIPKNKADLIRSIQEQNIAPFLSNIWDAGHRPTNYEKWKHEIRPYKVKWQPDFEPYIVVKSDVVQYDERFIGFGWNKVSHIMELEAQEYEFIVLSDVFIIHNSHSPSYDKLKYRISSTYRSCLHLLKNEFLETMKQKYKRSFDLNVSLKSFLSSEKQKRSLYEENDSSTNLYDSTDYYLLFGGPEKYHRKKQYKKIYNLTNDNLIGYVKDGIPEVETPAAVLINCTNDNSSTPGYHNKTTEILNSERKATNKKLLTGITLKHLNENNHTNEDKKKYQEKYHISDYSYDFSYYYDNIDKIDNYDYMEISEEEYAELECKNNMQIVNHTLPEDSGEVEWIYFNITNKT